MLMIRHKIFMKANHPFTQRLVLVFIRNTKQKKENQQRLKITNLSSHITTIFVLFIYLNIRSSFKSVYLYLHILQSKKEEVPVVNVCIIYSIFIITYVLESELAVFYGRQNHYRSKMKTPLLRCSQFTSIKGFQFIKINWKINLFQIEKN